MTARKGRKPPWSEMGKELLVEITNLERGKRQKVSERKRLMWRFQDSTGAIVPPARITDLASSAISLNDSAGARSMYLRVTSNAAVPAAAPGVTATRSAVRRIRPSLTGFTRETRKAWIRWS